MRILFAALTIALAAGTASAGTIFVSDFTAPAERLAAYGGNWSWDSPTRTLQVAASNTPADYLQQVFFSPGIDITGGTGFDLTGSWVPAGDGGDFILRLLNNGAPVAQSTFSYGQFSGGPKTVSAPLSWLSLSLSTIDQLQILGNGNSSTALGDFQLTLFTVSDGAASVPEIDPASFGSAGAFMLAALALVERRRLRQLAAL
jgi:hypothetical protein